MKYTELPEPPKVGDMAPEISQATPDGDTIKLSDYRVKYVLPESRVSDCSRCRGSNKEIYPHPGKSRLVPVFSIEIQALTGYLLDAFVSPEIRIK